MQRREDPLLPSRDPWILLWLSFSLLGSLALCALKIMSMNEVKLSNVDLIVALGVFFLNPGALQFEFFSEVSAPALLVII